MSTSAERMKKLRDLRVSPFRLENKEAKELYELALNNILDKLGDRLFNEFGESHRIGLVAEEMRRIKGEGVYKNIKKEYIPIFNLKKYETQFQYKR